MTRVLGWQVTHTYCRECAPEGLRDFHAPLREGDDAGIPYHCDTCDNPLLPCEHEWGDWRSWFDGGEWRHCNRPHCEAKEHRELATEPRRKGPS